MPTTEPGLRVTSRCAAEQALAFYRSVDATRYVRKAEALLRAVSEIPA